MTTALTVTPIIQAELKEAGYQESPPNSNHTKYGVEFGLDREPWCAIFQYVEFLHTFGHVPWDKTASTLGIASQFEALHRFSADPRKGALALYSFGRVRIDHVELVIAYNSKQIHVVGGNTSAADGSPNNGGEVAAKWRNRDDTVRGFAIIPYIGAAGHKAKKHHDLGVRIDLREGDVDPDVLIWKHDLERLSRRHALPIRDLKLAENQKFGNRTDDATRAFQKAHALIVDGIVGNHTVTAAERILERRRKRAA